MNKIALIILAALISTICCNQNNNVNKSLEERLDIAYQKFVKDTQLTYAITGFYVQEVNTGKTIYNVNGNYGLAPASSQKVFTAIAALEILGSNFKYNTTVFLYNNKSNKQQKGLFIKASGDPSFCTWRFNNTNNLIQLQQVTNALKNANIGNLQLPLIIETGNWPTQTTPNGWIWEDVGNYYGAGHAAINFNENQYDINFKPGNHKGDAIKGFYIKQQVGSLQLNTKDLLTGAPSSGDNSIIYTSENNMAGYVKGTVPAGVSEFIVSGSHPNSNLFFNENLQQYLAKNNINSNKVFEIKSTLDAEFETEELTNIQSPPLDSLLYFFLKKSINLYGEAFVKTIGMQKNNNADSGLAILHKFFKENGIDDKAINTIDGSGLSPQNRVTAKALAQAMAFASTRPYFNTFYNALPVIDNKVMKSGSISGAVSYTGYITNKAGIKYSFGFIVNNFMGKGKTVNEKMWKLLDELR